MKVIAIDPSINNIGWAEAEDGNLLNSGLIKTKGKTNGEKLLYIFDALKTIVSNEAANYREPIKYAYVDRTLYKGLGKSIQNIFKFAKAIGIIEYFFKYWVIPIKQPSRKLARKLNAIIVAKRILNECRWKKLGENKYMFPDGSIRELTTHEAEAIVWAIFYSRMMDNG